MYACAGCITCDCIYFPICFWQAFNSAWEGIVAHHGVDWCGFTKLQQMFHQFHRQGVCTVTSDENNNIKNTVNSKIQNQNIKKSDDGSIDDDNNTYSNNNVNIQMISLELWDSASGQLVSAEVGFIVGSCYTCLSLFGNDKDFPKCMYVY